MGISAFASLSAGVVIQLLDWNGVLYGTIPGAAAFSQQYRFAATECVSAAAAPKAISIVLFGSIFGAFLGPGLMSWGEAWVAGARFGGSFAAIAGCHLLGAAALLALRPMTPSAEEEPTGGARPLRVIARGRFFIAAVTGGVVIRTVLVTTEAERANPCKLYREH